MLSDKGRFHTSLPAFKREDARCGLLSNYSTLSFSFFVFLFPKKAFTVAE